MNAERRTQNAERRTQNAEVCSIFDTMSSNDLIIAFFPCIYFETMSNMYFSLDSLNNAHKQTDERIVDAIERLEKRTYFHTLLYKLYYLAEHDKLKLVIENPATTPSYLIGTQNFIKPTIIDKNRMTRGDYFKKPTAYWFIGFEPTHGYSYQNDKEQRIINDMRSAPKAGMCSEERSMISPDYARNFICDFILGKQQPELQQSEFDFSA